MSAAESLPAPLLQPIAVTFFSGYGASSKREEVISLTDLRSRVQITTGSVKAQLPWLKLARFGDQRTDKGSLRHDRNVIAISGVEGDYDAEIITVDEAVAMLRHANIAGMIYTSPSHTEDTPRWRVLCPLSRDIHPEGRTAIVERLNGVFHGGLSGESFTLSQSYYFGSVNASPSHRVELVEGDFIDGRPDLDAAAIGRPKVEYVAPTGPIQPRTTHTDRFIEAVITRALNRVRSAPDGQKHHVLRAQARVLGGYQHIGGYTSTSAVEWLVAALPATAKDLRAARNTAAWGLESGASQPLTIPELVRTPSPPPELPDDPNYWNSLAEDANAETDEIVTHRVAMPFPEAPAIKILRFKDIEPVLDQNELVEDVLGAGTMSVVYGQSNSGKTFFATDLGMHIACGWPWRGKAVEQRAVIYCALEGSHGIRNRLAAFAIEHGLTGKDIPFGVVPVPLDILNSTDPEALVAAIKVEAADLGIPCGLIVLDTLARAMAGGNENAPDDMGALVRHGDLIRHETDAHLMWIHHAGKDDAKGARGHSSLRAATDTEIEISAEGGFRVARVTKQRDLEGGGEYPFTLKVVEIGANQRGKMLTSCVVQSGDASDEGTAPTPRRRLTGHNKRAFEVLTDLIASTGQTGHAGIPDGASSIPEQWWRERFYDRAMPGAEGDAKKKAFRRAADTLVADRVVGMVGKRVWVVE